MNSNPNIDIAILVKNHLAAKKWDMHAQPEVVESAVQAVFEKVPDLIEEIVDHDFMAQACFGHSKKRRTRPKEQTAEAPSATSGSPTATRPSALAAGVVAQTPKSSQP